jgi:putative transposase
MPKGLKRYYGRGHLHFLTFSCYRRLPLLGTKRARNMFVKELRRVRREYGFLLVGYVVMPNHVHLLMSEPKKGTPSTVLQMLKQRVSRKMRMKERKRPKGQLALKFPKFITDLPQFWQPRFYDFNVFSHEKKKEKLEYMHANPVVRGTRVEPQGLAMEQFFLLCERRCRIGRNRSCQFVVLRNQERPKKKPHPHKSRVGHPVVVRFTLRAIRRVKLSRQIQERKANPHT